MNTSNHRHSGFTTIEMVMVMVIIGILAVVAVARWPTNIEVGPTARQLAEDIRSAQNLSMNRNGGYGIERIAAQQYRLTQNGNTLQTRPAEAPLSNFSLRFNSFGRPESAPGVPLANNVTIQVAGGLAR